MNSSADALRLAERCEQRAKACEATGPLTAQKFLRMAKSYRELAETLDRTRPSTEGPNTASCSQEESSTPVLRRADVKP